MATEPGLYIGKESVTFDFEGAPVFISPTTVVRAGHPIMEGRENLFEPLVIHFDVAPAAEKSDTSTETADEPVRRGPGRPRKETG